MHMSSLLNFSLHAVLWNSLFSDKFHTRYAGGRRDI